TLPRLFSGFLIEHTAGMQSPFEETVNYPLLLVSTLIALGGIGVAWWMYVKQPGMAGRLALRFQGLYQLSLNKFHVDELYAALILAPLAGFTAFCRIFDQYILDGIVDLIGQMPRLLAVVFRPVPNRALPLYPL